MAKITFLGAAQTVTGSKHLLSLTGHRVMVDCGLYQGLKPLRMRNWEPFPLPPDSIDAIVLTHAHIDHCGFLPRLALQGFRGKVFATPATCDITKIMLPDSGRLQEEEARYANKEGVTKHSPALPLYTEEDAKRCLALLSPVPYDRPFLPFAGLELAFREAGHILGSAMVEARFTEEGKATTVVFSGDLGRLSAPILRDPATIKEADFLVLESTYGDRLHTDIDRKQALAGAIVNTLKRRGVVLIPSFAVERTQELLYILHILKAHRDIPNVPVYVDSPMAVSVTKIFSRYRDLYDSEANELIKAGEDIMGATTIKFCQSVEESKKLNSLQGPMIILSASGMATGGRILHHLKTRLGDARNTVLLVGYQAVGTRGRRLQEGEKSIKIFGEKVDVKAEVASIDGFSSHADYGEIMSWLSGFTRAPKKVFLVHGEEASLEGLKKTITEKLGWEVHVPAYQEEVAL
ncbi:MAG: MBL fold metallo-hydrolase [Candidatus Eremiobacteraeota bacterium]|nr:MBL fold metallo-hydrolase [Candidatus Eremiobacteraeota bacterium]